MRLSIITFLICLLSVSCNQEGVKRYVVQGFAQGTTYSIVYVDTKQRVTKNDIAIILSEFDRSCSLFNPNSLINSINARQDSVMDINIKECIELAHFLSDESEGMYDVTVKPLIDAYGFAAANAQKSVNVDSILQFVGYKKIKTLGDTILLPSGVEIDLNSIAQGYSVDKVAELFDQEGIENYLIEIGGEVFCRGKNFEGGKWRIGIDKPIDDNFSPGANLQTIIELDSGRGLATSGNYRRYKIVDGKRINHTICPVTGMSIDNNLLSATVIASTSALADGYGTMLMALGVERAV
ncbi:MAG: FAD:protein FMN transferase, partial [Rikenellaceae bacterium]